MSGETKPGLFASAHWWDGEAVAQTRRAIELRYEAFLSGLGLLDQAKPQQVPEQVEKPDEGDTFLW